MTTYTDAPPPDALRQAQTDLGNVKDIMVNNIDAVRLTCPFVVECSLICD